MRIFEQFPKEFECIVCKTNKNSECILVPIDGTLEGRNEEATPVHVDCLKTGFRYNKEVNFIYINLNKGE